MLSNDSILVTILVPALNESLTIGEFVDWCKEGLKRANVSGQILIVDSSTDNTAEIARAHGAEVLSVPKRGLGRAYIDAIPYVKGRYVIMGDCDLTYDFREIKPFIDKLEEGFEFVIGSRFKGYIQPNAMPKLHRFFGTPMTTAILNFIYHSNFSDIHCGMRAMTKEALIKIKLKSQSWEYASEIVIKSVKLKFKITEVPINFYKDREGRLSHHKRSGWASAWIAGWINLKSMFIFAPEFFVTIPGILFFTIGILLTTSLIGGQYSIGVIGLNLNWMLLGLTMTILGYSSIQFGIISRIFYNFNPDQSKKILKILSYNRGVLSAVILVSTGFILNLYLLIQWLGSGLRLEHFYYPGLWGLMSIILGFQTFTFTLLVQMIAMNHQEI